MAIVQISKIIHRTGSVSEIPQLDVGEIGFASDEQRVFIGNDPAWVPPVGNDPTNTEILTNSPNCKIDFSQGSGTLEVPVDRVRITGGDDGYVLQTDGTGNLAWVDVPGLSGNVTSDIIIATHNGSGTNFKVGDDAWIGDINTVNTLSIRGVQDASKGYVTFGNADTTSKLGRNGSGPLTYTGSFSATGNIAATGNISATSYSGDGSNLTGISGPVFAAHNTVNQTLTNGLINLLYTTADTDSGSFYDNSTGIYAPQVAGWYQVNASLFPELVSGSTPNATFILEVCKNGSIEAVGPLTSVNPTWGTITVSNTSKLIYLNGTTDTLNCKVNCVIFSGTWRTSITKVNYFQATWVHA